MRFILILLWTFSLMHFTANAQQKVKASYGAINRSTPKFGFNTNAHIPFNFPPGYAGANWTQQWFVDSTAYLNPELLRYPGGTNANHWDWKTGWYFPAYQPPSGGKLNIRADEFKAGVTACKGEGVYVVNLETSDVHYEMQGLKHADSIGLQLNYIELGNEHNLNGGTQFPLQLMTPKNYALLGKVFYDSISVLFPTAKICAVGGNTPALTHWVDTVLAYIPAVDAFSFHVYTNANNTDNVFNVNRALAVPFGPYSNTASLLYRYNMSGFNTLHPSKEVWVTEFNLLESASGVPAIISQTWTHVLYNIAMCNFFLTKDNISMILNHSLAGDNHFQSISRQNKKITANALSMKLLYDMARGSTSTQNITFSGQPSIIYGTSTIPKLIGWKFNYPTLEKGFICNFSKDTFEISLSDLFSNAMQIEQYSADTSLVVNGISSLNKYSGSTTDTVIVYPYSITQIQSNLNTSIKEIISTKNNLWIYPNPAKNTITIGTETEMQEASVSIYNVLGEEVLKLTTISAKTFTINTETLPLGTYVLKINAGGEVRFGKFIVE